jgi:hypothetical protein
MRCFTIDELEGERHGTEDMKVPRILCSQSIRSSETVDVSALTALCVGTNAVQQLQRAHK